MRHQKRGRKLNRNATHRKAMFANMAMSLFEHERIQTTTPKAKELRSFAAKLITLAKRGDQHARRRAGRIVRREEILDKLFDELGPRFADRNGGYTRIFKLGRRHGDNAEMAVIELVDIPEAEVDPEALEADEDAELLEEETEA